MIPIAKPLICEEEMNAVMEVMRTGNIAEGKTVAEFESAFAKFTGTKHAVAVNSGTAALHCSLLACGIGTGDEVITTPFTFIATSNSILHAGALPVFADINEDTYNIDVDSIAEKITGRTKAIMPVHLYGHPADLKATCELAEDHNLVVIEDACQAHGAEYHGRKVGSFGVGCFSFYPTKNMTTGEGGIITTNDKRVAERARIIRNHGSSKRYYHDVLGYNLRMTNINAAIGLEQLKKLPGFNRARQQNAKQLTEKISSFASTPCVKKDCVHVFHQYTIRVDGNLRDDVVEKLVQRGVGANIYYPVPVHKQSLYQKLGYTGQLPVSEKASREVLSLPIHPSVTKEDINHMALALEEVLA